MSETRNDPGSEHSLQPSTGAEASRIDLASVVVPVDDVLFTPLHNDEAVLVALGSKAQFTLNETGADIWRWLADAEPLSSVSERLQQHYDVSAARADASVLSLVRSLVSHQLCRVSPTRPSAADESDR